MEEVEMVKQTRRRKDGETLTKEVETAFPGADRPDAQPSAADLEGRFRALVGLRAILSRLRDQMAAGPQGD